MKTSILSACLILGFANSAFAGQKLNPITEKVPTYKAQENHHAEDYYTIHHQVEFKSGRLGEIKVVEDRYTDHPLKFEKYDHALIEQSKLMAKLELMKQEHNEAQFQNQERQIERVTSWLEQGVKQWVTIERVKD